MGNAPSIPNPVSFFKTATINPDPDDPEIFSVNYPGNPPENTVLYRLTPNFSFTVSVFVQRQPPSPVIIRYRYRFMQVLSGQVPNSVPLNFDLVYTPSGTTFTIENVTNATPQRNGNDVTFTMNYGTAGQVPPVVYKFTFSSTIPLNERYSTAVLYSAVSGEYTYTAESVMNVPANTTTQNIVTLQQTETIKSIKSIEATQVDPCDLSEVPRVIIDKILSSGANLGACIIFVNDTILYDSDAYSQSILCPEQGIFQTIFVKYPQIQYTIKYRPFNDDNNNNNKCNTKKAYDKIVNDTLAERVAYLIEAYNLVFPEEEASPEIIFYRLLSFYAVSKYTLAGLIYNDFNEKYLLRKYYEQFLIDLRNSRFSKFEIFFTNPAIGFADYTKYFLYDIRQADINNLMSGCNIVNGNTDSNTNGTIIKIKPRFT